MSTLPKAKTTKRRFYNKWLYKVSLRQNGAGMLRDHDLYQLQDFCLSSQPVDRHWTSSGRAWPHRLEILALAEFLSDYDPKSWAKRIEHTTVDLYTNDPKFYKEVADEFANSVLLLSEPDEDSIELLEQHQIILSKKLPHDRYRYRVYLKPHVFGSDVQAKTKYIAWIKSQGDRITLTPAVEFWFLKTVWNWDRRYVLVEDEQTLLMLKLRASDIVGKVYNYVISDK